MSKHPLIEVGDMGTRPGIRTPLPLLLPLVVTGAIWRYLATVPIGTRVEEICKGIFKACKLKYILDRCQSF
jgi:hypothetical protein